jgi:hypothetical protein
VTEPPAFRTTEEGGDTPDTTLQEGAGADHDRLELREAYGDVESTTQGLRVLRTGGVDSCQGRSPAPLVGRSGTGD